MEVMVTEGLRTILSGGYYAIDLHITRSLIYLWTVAFPTYGKFYLQLFRLDRPLCPSNSNGNYTGTYALKSITASATVS